MTDSSTVRSGACQNLSTDQSGIADWYRPISDRGPNPNPNPISGTGPLYPLHNISQMDFLPYQQMQ